LTLRKPDGELITLNLDAFSHVEIDQPAAIPAPAAPTAGDGEKKNATDLPV
jgi:hypothetical protein